MTSDPYLDLERQWGAKTGLYRMVACASGTAALHLAFEALELPKGSEVIMGDFNMIACPRAAVMAGLVPVFVGCRPDLTVNCADVVCAVGSNTSAILATHIYGRSCDMPLLTKVAESSHLRLVEDMAEAHCQFPNPESDAACWSFYKNKVVAGEEGGAVGFHHAHHRAYGLAKSLRSMGFTAEHNYMHIPRGWNHRLSNLHARPILESIETMEMSTRSRNEIVGWFDRCIPDLWRMPPRITPWVYDVRLRGLPNGKLDGIVRGMTELGYRVRHGFKPMSQQEEFMDCRCLDVNRSAQLASREIMYFDLSPERWAGPRSVEKAIADLTRLVG